MLVPYGDRLLRPDEVLGFAREIMATRFAEANCGFAAGSLLRGEGTLYSDLDLVVLYPKIDSAWRETIRHKGLVVELFVNDPETQRWYMHEGWKNAERAGIHMVAEGTLVPAVTPLGQIIKDEASALLAKGPKPPDEEMKARLRYTLSCLIEDLCGGLNAAGRLGCGGACLKTIAEIAIRQRGGWLGSGKWLLKALAVCDEGLAKRAERAAEALFLRGEVASMQALAADVLEPWGGWLIEGYRATAKPDQRVRTEEMRP